MIKNQLGYITIITSLATTNIAFGESNIISGEENINEFVKEIDFLLKKKYTNSKEYGDINSKSNSIYEINADDEKIENSFDLKLKIEEYILKEKVLDIEIIDKGHKEENGEIVGREYSAYDRYETSEQLYEIYENNKNELIISDIKTLDKNNLKTTIKEDVEKVKITLINGKIIEIIKGNDKLDFTKYIDKNGNRVDLTNVDINSSEGFSVVESITGFERQRELWYLKEFDIPSKVIAKVKIIEDGFIEETNIDEFYNGAYTEKGENFIKYLAKKVLYYNGDKFNINYELLEKGTDDEKVNNNVSKIIYKDGKYSFDIKMNLAKDTSFYLINNQNFKMTIYSSNQVRLDNFRQDVINAILNENDEMINRAYYTLSGEDRFETSVKVSQEYSNINKADGIVLVGEDAIVDGLSAAPFAKYKNSPILLSKKDEVPKVVMEEIKRIFNKFNNVDTVYIIGGENTISDKVKKQLISELGNVRVMRISGKDRYETSINICEKMDLSNKNKAYVVGGYGEADAMSIAPLAVREGSPIIVSPKDGLTQDAKYFFDINENIVDVDVIGGRNNVSTEVMLDIKNCGYDRERNHNISVERISGDDRQETNAKILGLFKNEEDIIVAKDGMNNSSHLVDSLSASLFGYPIVLGSEDINFNQVNAVKSIASSDGCKLTKVGNGISEKIIKNLISLFE